MLIPLEEIISRYNIHPKGCAHLGSSEGQESNDYWNAGIKEVIWVEALPNVYRILLNHIKKGSIAFNACVSDVDGEKRMFNIASNEGQSSSLLDFDTHATEHPTVKFIDKIQVETIRVDTLFKNNNINITGDWFLNIDLQGAELMALKGMGELLHKFKWAYIEVNEKHLYKDCPLVKDIDDYMRLFGFEGVECKMTNFGWGDKLYIKDDK